MTSNRKQKVATIGFFDGVHLGHRYLLQQLINIAEEKKQNSLAITFPVHPRKILHADFQPKLLTNLDEKLHLLRSTGINEVALLDFSPETARLSAFCFMKTILKEQYNVSTLLIGYDHRFGHRRSENFSDYAAYGKELDMEVVQAACFPPISDTGVSSSEIRRNISQGNIPEANRMLGYTYSISGKVIDGHKIGRKIGFPTANISIEDEEKMLPPQGVYAVKLHYRENTYSAMMNIGQRPTFDNGNTTSLEVHIFNFDKNIYQEDVRVDFLEKIRDEYKFQNVEQLIEQLHRDKKTILSRLGG